MVKGVRRHLEQIEHISIGKSDPCGVTSKMQAPSLSYRKSQRRDSPGKYMWFLPKSRRV